ncbi:hypothetical protein DSO57_1002580 [Entomophthora muscae]|uniref:Uncharacterized protein n=1 Tax=Entomophthora muscae TaxID=34485 RepID=A0ACC2U755_9FUNG|nr:hypothetical protein DSO57_1002580 [Entomophthora muscae]
MAEARNQAKFQVLEAAEKLRAKAHAAPTVDKIPIGTEVLVFKNLVSQLLSKKFLLKWSGMYKVIGHATSNNYYLIDQQGVATKIQTSPAKVSYNTQGALNESPLDVSNVMNESGGNVKWWALPPN